MAKSAPDACGCPPRSSAPLNVVANKGAMSSGMTTSTTSGVGSRRSTRSSLRAIAALRDGDTVVLRVVAAAGERQKDAVEAGADQLDAAQAIGRRSELGEDHGHRTGGVRRVDAH